jgi:hypothetical protein
MNHAKAIGQRDGRWAGGVGMAVGAAFAAALIGLANAPVAGAEGGALDTAVDNFLQGIANVFPPEFNEGSLGDPDAFCLTFFTCMDNDQMIDSLYQAINTDFQPEGPIDNFFDQLLGTAPAADPAQALDIQVDISGLDLFPTAGNTATADAGLGSIAIAIGAGSFADTGTFGDVAFADGANSTAETLGLVGGLDSALVFGANSTAEAGGLVGSLDSALVFGANSIAQAGGIAGGLDSALVFGANSTAEAGETAGAVLGAPGNFDLAAAFGDMLHAIATGGNFLVDIVP